jgi:hypothetical protein
MSTRAQILKTPGKIILDAAGTPVEFYSSDGISVELMEDQVTLTNSKDGTFDERATGRMVVVKLKPTQFTAAALTALFTHGAKAKGASLLSGSDITLDVHTIDGQRRRIPSAFVYAEPSITCSAGKTILGEVTFYGILPIGADPAVLANFYALTSVAFPSDAGWDIANELTPSWDFSWSSGSASDWDAIDTKAGVTISSKSSLTEDKVDGRGLINVTIQDYEVEAKADVLNISEALILEARGFGAALGSSRAALGRDLKLEAVGGGAYVWLKNAVLQAPSALAMNATETVGGAGLMWKARPLFSSGVQGSSLIISTTNPD